MVDKKYSWPALSDTAGTHEWKEGDAFSGVQASHYWSSTAHADFTGIAWFVILVNDYVHYFNKTYPNYVWPVRGGH